MKRMIKKIPFKDKEEWLKIRKDYIGSSEVPIILGLSPFSTAEKLFDKKINGEVEIVNERMEWGLILEDVIAKEYAKRKGISIIKPKYIFNNIHYPHLIASVDYLIKGADVILEIKNSGYFKSEIFGIPAYVYAQVQTQMMCSGKSKVIVVALISGSELREFEIIEDADWMTKINKYSNVFMQALKEKDFGIFQDFVNKNEIEVKSANEKELSNEEIDRLIEIDELIKELSKEKEGIVSKLKEQFKESGDEKWIVNNRIMLMRSIREYIDTKGLKVQYPEIAEQMIKRQETIVLKII